jgi:hypothetical protein
MHAPNARARQCPEHRVARALQRRSWREGNLKLFVRARRGDNLPAPCLPATCGWMHPERGGGGGRARLGTFAPRAFPSCTAATPIPPPAPAAGSLGTARARESARQ